MNTSETSGLRLARMAGESVLTERLLPKDRLDRGSVALVAAQMKRVIEAMRMEWKVNPSSGEITEAFDLVLGYLQCLEAYASGARP